MAVFVDPIQEYHAPAFKHPGKWCHMMADSLAELHEMADRIGLRRAWFQNKNTRFPHYDLTPGKRAQAIRCGAVAVTTIEMIRLCKREG